MFTFFHRKTKIVVDCFTKDSYIHKLVPIQKAIKTVPDWWKKLPANIEQNHSHKRPDLMNMKSCEGFLQLYKRGFVIEAWGDFNFTVSPNSTYTYNISNGDLPRQHERRQFGNAFPNHEHAKLENPWLIRSAKNHYFHFGPASWSLDAYDFTILPGVAEYYIQHATHINFMIPIRNEEYTFIIPAGNPLVHLTPLNDSYEYVVKNHLIDVLEFSQIASSVAKSFFGYRGLKKLINREEKRSAEKCPFH